MNQIYVQLELTKTSSARYVRLFGRYLNPPDSLRDRQYEG